MVHQAVRPRARHRSYRSSRRAGEDRRGLVRPGERLPRLRHGLPVVAGQRVRLRHASRDARGLRGEPRRSDRARALAAALDGRQLRGVRLRNASRAAERLRARKRRSDRGRQGTPARHPERQDRVRPHAASVDRRAAGRRRRLRLEATQAIGAGLALGLVLLGWGSRPGDAPRRSRRRPPRTRRDGNKS